MSIAILPQERRSENLVYVILPLGIALFAVTRSLKTEGWLNGVIKFESWFALVSFFASFLALLLYMISPDEIIIRAYYRHLVKSRYKKNLVAHYERFDCLASIEQNEEDRGELVETMIGNAVSSGSISRRLVRVRALGYFLVAYPFYVLSGVLIFFYVFGEVPNDYVLTIDVFVIFSCIIFGVLIYLSFVRHPLTRGIDTTMQFVADFLYLRVLEGIYTLGNKSTMMPDSIRLVLDHMENLLTRNDFDVFDIVWKKVVLKKLAPGESNQEEKKDVTYFNHQWALYSFIISGFFSSAILTQPDILIPFLGLPIWLSMVTAWIFLGMIWSFRVSLYTRCTWILRLAAIFTLSSFVFAGFELLRHFYSPVLSPPIHFSTLFAVTIILTACSIWRTSLFAKTEKELVARRLAGWVVGFSLFLVGVVSLLPIFGIFVLALGTALVLTIGVLYDNYQKLYGILSKVFCPSESGRRRKRREEAEAAMNAALAFLRNDNKTWIMYRSILSVAGRYKTAVKVHRKTVLLH